MEDEYEDIPPPNEAAPFLRVAPTLAVWRIQDRGPGDLKLGRRVRYSRAKLLDRLESQAWNLSRG